MSLLGRPQKIRLVFDRTRQHTLFQKLAKNFGTPFKILNSEETAMDTQNTKTSLQRKGKTSALQKEVCGPPPFQEWENKLLGSGKKTVQFLSLFTF